jgi:hypothetical protein
MNFKDLHADALLKLELFDGPDRNLQNESLALMPEKLSVFDSTAVIFSIWSGPHFPGKLSFEDTVSPIKSGQKLLVQAGFELAPHSRGEVQSLWDKQKQLAFFGIEGGTFILAKATGGADIAADSIDHLYRYIDLLFGTQSGRADYLKSSSLV